MQRSHAVLDVIAGALLSVFYRPAGRFRERDWDLVVLQGAKSAANEREHLVDGSHRVLAANGRAAGLRRR
jgi:hypothetical protein